MGGAACVTMSKKPTKKQIREVMSYIGSIKTPKRTEAARKTAALARASFKFKYRKLMPEDVADIRANCPMKWEIVLQFSEKYKVNPATIYGILKGSKHADTFKP